MTNDGFSSPGDGRRPRIGLALSGAVMRGFAHLGVLKVLEAAAIPVDCLAGSSAGALVGALYGAGMPVADIEALAMQVRWRDVARPVWPRRGFFRFDRLEEWLIAQIGDLTFGDLQRPLAVVATDLSAGRPVTFTEGRVAPAVRASCSVPGIFEPAELDGLLLGDGGVSNNLPVSAARGLGAEFVIGVDLFIPAIRRGWGPLGFGFAAIETLVRRSGGGVDAADCLISPDVGGASYLRTSQNRRLVALGAAAARAALPDIQAALAGAGSG
ncbi:MAG: hypothetical protein D6796_01905 [Caldilineae bacterium]|nr:MAG: hypothetical protein D6796_01905 [Caldilineae bacterium]